ncbi:MAG: CocE/NonD family hydrolase [Hyphomicrobium sp.]|jgi:hypothetical protein
MTTSDGVQLDADVYRPDAAGPFPVLLMRQPYGRKIAATVVYAHPAWYAAHGYIVVVQDVRGRGTSGGTFRLFQDDVRDGAEAIAWAAALPGATGKVAMYGFSYQGVTQLLALAAAPPQLATICPAMCSYDIYDDWAYEGGAFCFSSGLGWGIQMAAEEARLAGDATAHHALLAASRNLPLNEPAPFWPSVMEAYGNYSHFPQWISHPRRDDYWDLISPRTTVAETSIDIPVLHIGGWFDSFLTGTIGFWKNAAAQSHTPQKLIIGPWTHIPWGRTVGAVDMGRHAASSIDEYQVAWFDMFLKGSKDDTLSNPRVELFDLVEKTWRGFDAWPADPGTRLYLAGKGLSATTSSGRLLPKAEARATVDRFVHDPWRPAPSMGGHNCLPAGMQNRAGVDDRTDVLVYTSPVCVVPLVLAGEVNVVLSVSADQPCFDVSAVLARVTPEGAAYNLTQGHARIEQGQGMNTVRVAMRATCATLKIGDALRLSISAANFPAFAVNPGTGADPRDVRLIDCRVTTLSVTTGGDDASFVELPVAGAIGVFQ